MKSLILFLALMGSACNAVAVCWTDEDGYQQCTYYNEGLPNYTYPNKKTKCWTDPAGYTYCEPD